MTGRGHGVGFKVAWGFPDREELIGVRPVCPRVLSVCPRVLSPDREELIGVRPVCPQVFSRLSPGFFPGFSSRLSPGFLGHPLNRPLASIWGWCDLHPANRLRVCRVFRSGRDALDPGVLTLKSS